MLKYVKKNYLVNKNISQQQKEENIIFSLSFRTSYIHCKLFSLKKIGDIPFQYLSDSM